MEIDVVDYGLYNQTQRDQVRTQLSQEQDRLIYLQSILNM